MTDRVSDSAPVREPPRRRRAPNAPPAGSQAFGRSPAATHSDIVHQSLRRDIIAMKLVPGTPISETEIARAHGISRTPAREAVLRLAREKLVEVVPKSGTYVARIPLSALSEAIVVRRALEAVTVRAAAEHATGSEIAGLQALVQRQQEKAEAGDEAAFHAADEAFHAGIARAGRYPGIWETIQQVKVNVDRYRRLTLPQAGRMKLVVGEHLAVLEAIAARDADLAASRMESHLGKLQLDIAVFRDLWPHYFVHDREIEGTGGG